MGDFITLTCPSCGGKLQITSDINRFACAYCGIEHLVRRTSSLVTLVPAEEALNNIQANTDRAASELAIHRLTGELATLRSQASDLGSKMGSAFAATPLRAVISGYIHHAPEYSALRRVPDAYMSMSELDRINVTGTELNAYKSLYNKMRHRVETYRRGPFEWLYGSPTREEMQTYLVRFKNVLTEFEKNFESALAIRGEIERHQRIVNGS